MIEILEKNALVFSFLFSTFAFLGMVFQSYLTNKRTKYLIKNIKYSSYLKQLDELNMVNQMLINPDELKNTFSKFNVYKDLNTTDLGFAWLVINRYEGAFKANELGLLKKEEWKVIEKRIRKDFQYDVIKEVWNKDYFGFDYDVGFYEYINNKIIIK